MQSALVHTRGKGVSSRSSEDETLRVQVASRGHPASIPLVIALSTMAHIKECARRRAEVSMHSSRARRQEVYGLFK